MVRFVSRASPYAQDLREGTLLCSISTRTHVGISDWQRTGTFGRCVAVVFLVQIAAPCMRQPFALIAMPLTPCARALRARSVDRRHRERAAGSVDARTLAHEQLFAPPIFGRGHLGCRAVCEVQKKW